MTFPVDVSVMLKKASARGLLSASVVKIFTTAVGKYCRVITLPSTKVPLVLPPKTKVLKVQPR